MYRSLTRFGGTTAALVSADILRPGSRWNFTTTYVRYGGTESSAPTVTPIMRDSGTGWAPTAAENSGGGWGQVRGYATRAVEQGGDRAAASAQLLQQQGAVVDQRVEVRVALLEGARDLAGVLGEVAQLGVAGRDRLRQSRQPGQRGPHARRGL